MGLKMLVEMVSGQIDPRATGYWGKCALRQLCFRAIVTQGQMGFRIAGPQPGGAEELRPPR